MADESAENRDPQSERSGQSSQDGENGQPGLSSSRRRLIFTGLLTAPAVMTLGSRAARSQTTTTPQTTPSCMASTNPSHTCH
jgi:hypothetical protein